MCWAQKIAGCPSNRYGILGLKKISVLRLISQESFDPKTTKQDFSPALSCTILFKLCVMHHNVSWSLCLP